MCYTSINFFILFYRPAKTELEKAIELSPPNLAQLEAILQEHQDEARKQQQHLKDREISCHIDDKKVGDPWITIATNL